MFKLSYCKIFFLSLILVVASADFKLIPRKTRERKRSEVNEFILIWILDFSRVTYQRFLKF